MAVDKIFDAMQKEIKTLTINDLDVETTHVGLKASPTRVARSFTPQPKGKGKMLEGTTKDRIEQLVVELKQKHVI